MIYNNMIIGKFVSLRSIQIEDAEVTLNMRIENTKTKFLHKVDNNLSKQIKWIQWQNNQPGDYLFLVSDKSDIPIGMMGIYEIDGTVGHIGRLLMYGNAIQSFEAYKLLIEFSFRELGLTNLWGDTDMNNKAAMNFSKQFGFIYEKPVYDSEMNRNVCYCNLSIDLYRLAKTKLENMIYRV